MADDRLKRTRDLLLQAVESLRDTSTTSQASVSNPPLVNASNTLLGSGSGGSAMRPDAMTSERNRLFNFGFWKKASGSGGSSSHGLKAPKSKKKRLNAWNHDFICLSSTTCTKPPTPFETGDLMRAGLGRKQITLFEHDGAAEVHAEIMLAFPGLKDGGGYELLRVGGSGARNTLQVIPQPAQGYTVSYLKEVVRQAKVYIRPVQRDLQLLPETILSSDLDCPSEECCICKEKIPLPQLREHVESCKEVKPEQPLQNEEDYPFLLEDTYFETAIDEHDAEGQDSDVAQGVEAQCDLAATEEAMMLHAVRESRVAEQEIIDLSTTELPPKTLKEAVLNLQMKLSSEYHEYHVRRSDVFCDLLRETKKRSYLPSKRVKTYFVGESGKDTGGLTRELWSLFSKHLQQGLCEGKENCLVIRHDATKLQEGVFRKVGMLIGVSIVQGGCGYPFFAPSTYSYICGVDLCSIVVGRDEIPDPEVEKTLQDITSAGADDDTLREVALNACDLLLSCGFTKPIATLKHQDVPQIIECVSLHTTILQVKAELDEMVKGLADAGVLAMMQEHPDLFRPLFVYSHDPLTADQLMDLFEEKVFSEMGSSEFVKEQATYMFFRDLLEELEGGIRVEGEDSDSIYDLSDCLSFFTGASRIPPTGFDSVCTLNFSRVNVYPTASTCALILTLPTMYHNIYHTFKEKMLFAFRNHGGFGLC